MSDSHLTRTPVDIATVSADDPHLQPSAQHPETVARWVAVLFVLGAIAMACFGACYWIAAPDWTYGASLGFGFAFLGIGLVAWGKYLMPRGPFVEQRHTLASTDVEREAFAHAIVERGGGVLKRRGFLGGLLGVGLGIFGIVAAFPSLRSLGPLPKDTLDETNWKKGSYLVDSSGRRVHVDDFDTGSYATVFPEGFEKNPDDVSQDQTMLIRISLTDFTTEPGRETWGPKGYLAYSKLCTHLGCPVGLYEQQLELLVCPCHQSMFNVKNGCVPIFGPAPRPLPQLPLAVDADGYLISQSGYHEAVGPGFWERS